MRIKLHQTFASRPSIETSSLYSCSTFLEIRGVFRGDCLVVGIMNDPSDINCCNMPNSMSASVEFDSHEIRFVGLGPRTEELGRFPRCV